MASFVLAKISDLLSQIHPSIVTPVLVLSVIGLMSWIYIKMARGAYDMTTLNKIPGPYPFPLIGNALDVAVPPQKFLKTMREICLQGPIVKFFLAHRPYVILTKAKGFETVLSSNKFLSKGPDYIFMRPWLGLGLLTSDGGKWHSRRKMLTPTFHFKILEDFLVIMNEQSQILNDKLSKLDPKQPVDIFPQVTYCALDIICESAMGKNVGAQFNSESAYVKSIFQASDVIFHRQVSPWLWNNFIFWFHPDSRIFKKSLNVLHNFTDKVIKERKEIYHESQKKKKETKEEDSNEILGAKKRLAFLDLLISASDNGKALSDEDIREEVDTFMFEGHDTTAANISFSLCLLAAHKEIQKKVQTELDDIFGEDLDRPMTSEDLNKMKYLESCLKESLRLFPSVPFMSRTIWEDTVIEVGRQIDFDNFLPPKPRNYIYEQRIQSAQQ